MLPVKTMPPPPPLSVGGARFNVGRARVEVCAGCEGLSQLWMVKDALDELQALDPLHYFAEPVDEDVEPSYRSVIPDPMDFSSMRCKLHHGEYSNAKAPPAATRVARVDTR